MSLDEVKPGMQGTGRSVFQGTEVEEFGVEILGVMPTSSPGGEMILARFSGMGLEDSGVIAGMSGSPVYVEGRLLGAVAFAWPFATVPIGGITPIASMLALEGRPGAEDEEGNPSSRPEGGLSPQTWEELLGVRGQAALDLLVGETAASAGSMPPLRVPVAMQGFGGPGLETTSRYLERLGFDPVAGGAVGSDSTATGSAALEPGSAVAVELVRGDAQLAGIGTVTWVEGDRILAFGHPMLNLGPSAYPMARASIVTVMPRWTNSFKMGVAGPPVGTIVRDDQTGIMGRLGSSPRLIPVEIAVEGGERSGAMHFEILDVDALTPALVGLVAMNSATTRMRAMGAATLRVETTVRLRDGRSVSTADRLAGFTPPADMAGEVARLVGLVASNPFEKVQLDAVSVRVQVENGIEAAFLDGISIPPGPHRPGSRIAVQTTLRDYRGSTWTRAIPLALPEGLAGGTYVLAVCDGAKASQEEEKRAPDAYKPRSLGQLLRLLEESTPHDVLVVRLYDPEGSPLAAGRELPRLPSSVRSAVQSPLATGGSEETQATIVAETLAPMDKVVVGCESLPLSIEPAP